MNPVASDRARDRELMDLLKAVRAAGAEGLSRPDALKFVAKGRSPDAAKKQLTRLVKIARENGWLHPGAAGSTRYRMTESGTLRFERATPMPDVAISHLQVAYRLVDARLRRLFPALSESFDEVLRTLSIHSEPDAAMPVRVVAPSTLESTQLDEAALSDLDTIRQALADDRLLTFKYRSKRASRVADAGWRLIEPFGLVLHGERIYLAGRECVVAAKAEHYDRTGRVWRLAGLLDLKAEGRSGLSKAQRHAALDAFLADGLPLESPLDSTKGRGMRPQRVRLRVHEGVLGASGRAMFVRHLSELEIQGWVRTDVDAESGDFTWELERPVTEELYRWLLGYQPMLEVLEPQWLRERVANDLRSALERHGASP